MHYYIDIQKATDEILPVNDADLELWVSKALIDHMPEAEITLRIVDEAEITQLNTEYRKQPKSTNVLSFPFSLPEGVTLDCPLLGDVIICPAVLARESIDEARPLKAHWAHIVIHGVLHLLGYDHIEEADARRMQALETTILSNLGYANPYNAEDFDFET